MTLVDRLRSLGIPSAAASRLVADLDAIADDVVDGRIPYECADARGLELVRREWQRAQGGVQ